MANLAFVWLLVLVSAAVGGCGSTPVGTPRPETEVGLLCKLEHESSPEPAAAQVSEVFIEGEPSEGSVCVANHFRGRVDCPYGQTQTDYDAYLAGEISGQDGRLCRVSGGNTVVTGVVPEQLVQRTAPRTVYRSCHCANHLGERNDGGEYCDCPSTYTCAPLVDWLGFGSSSLAGSYCIQSGTEYDPSTALTSCSRATKNCGFDGQNP